MNWKNYFWLIAIVIVLFATSCSKDESVSQGYEAEVTFSLNVENAIATRAISDGKGADQLTFAVFSEDGTEVFTPKTTRSISKNQLLTGVEIKVTLVKGTYTAVFWAQNSNCTAYTVSDDMNVIIDYTGLNNDETRDAFFAVSEPFNVNNSISKDVILKRPFAQINVGAKEEDINAITVSGVKVTKSEAVIKDVPSELNLFNGNTDKYIDVNYALATVPNETLYVDVNKDGEKEHYKYLSMCYILSDTIGMTHTMAFNFKDVENNKYIGFSEGLEYVPAKRNWRTNVVGQIFTGPANFLVIIDPTYDNEHNIIK